LITATVARGVLGQPTTVGQAWASARPHLLRIMGLNLVLGVLAAVGITALVLVAAAAFAVDLGVGIAVTIVLVLGGGFAWIVVATRLSVAVAALVLETRPAYPGLAEQRPLGILDSLRRSWSLVTGRTPRTFGIVFVAGLIAGVVSAVIQQVFTTLGTALAGTGGPALEVAPGAPLGVVPLVVIGIGYVAGSVLQIAFLSAVTALVYIDARMRREGLDIVLAQAAAEPGGATRSPWATA
jgi:hypothetical protein